MSTIHPAGYRRRLPLSAGITLSLFALSPLAMADEPAVRHGSVSDRTLAIEGGFTATAQHANDSQVADEALLSFDLVSNIPAGPGEWTVYVEGSTTPHRDGVSSLLAEANADAGSALDRDGKARLQVSALNYRYPLGADSFTLGLVDPAGFLDASAVANDETSQFLGSGFVNNPTIEFPDYVLGGAYHHEAEGTLPGLTLFLSSSHGLADNPKRSYTQLIEVDEDGKGLFAAAEVYWERPDTTLRLGIWNRSDEHVRLDGDGTEENYGVYGVADFQVGLSRWNLRLGLANDQVSEAADFAALAVEYPVAGRQVGLGVARTGASGELGEDRDHSLQAELYVRFELSDNLHLTPALQYLENSGLQADDEISSDGIWLAGLRATYGFGAP